MRAGSLDTAITIQRASEVRSDLGEVTTVWAPLATVRAAVLQASTAEFLKGAGLQGDGAAVFRLRWLDGVTVRDRVLLRGAPHDIVEIKEIGRRRGLELRTVARNQ